MANLARPAEPVAFQRALKRAVFLPLVSLVLMAFVLIGLVYSLIHTQRWVDHTDEVIALANRVERGHVDLVAGYRGYLLTQDFAFPGVFQMRRAELDRDLQALRESVKDNPDQERAAVELRGLSDEWVRYASEGLAPNASRSEALARARAGLGQRYLDRLRIAVDNFIRQEQELRTVRAGRAYSSAVWTIVGIVALTLIVGALLAWSGRKLLYTLMDAYRRRVRDLEVARRDLEAAHADLEGRVEERTRELANANRELKVTEAIFQNIRDYAIFMLDPEGRILTWTPGAEQVEGYRASEVVGRHFSLFYTQEDLDRGHPEQELREALASGRYEEEGWRVRKGGERIWVNVIVTPLYEGERHLGFVKIVRDVTERRRADENLRAAFEELGRVNREAEARGIALSASNQELEAFCYSVSHDLRSPLRGIDGFSQVLLTMYGDRLDEKGRGYLERVRAATQRMGQLIDDLLKLSRLTRTEMARQKVDLSEIAHRTVNELVTANPGRKVDVRIRDGLVADGDPTLLGAVLENLLGNAWKFTSQRSDAVIELGATERDGRTIYYVRDNGAGFNMAYADKLFGAFQRLHKATEFPGTGIGLASVRRILRRHGGDIWAEGEVGRGAAFYFYLGQVAAAATPEAA